MSLGLRPKDFIAIISFSADSLPNTKITDKKKLTGITISRKLGNRQIIKTKRISELREPDAASSRYPLKRQPIAMTVNIPLTVSAVKAISFKK